MSERRSLTSSPAVTLVLAVLALVAGAAAIVIALLEVHRAIG